MNNQYGSQWRNHKYNHFTGIKLFLSQTKK